MSVEYSNRHCEGIVWTEKFLNVVLKCSKDFWVKQKACMYLWTVLLFTNLYLVTPRQGHAWRCNIEDLAYPVKIYWNK